MHRLQVCSTCLQSKIPSQQVHTLAATDNLLTKRKKCGSGVLFPSFRLESPPGGSDRRAPTLEVLERRKEKKKKRKDPVFYSSRKSGLPSWGSATERHQPYEVLEKKEF